MKRAFEYTVHDIAALADVRKWFTQLILGEELGLGFHPDTAFADYTIEVEAAGNDRPGHGRQPAQMFLPSDAGHMDALMEQCVEVCKSAYGSEDTIYEIAQEIWYACGVMDPPRPMLVFMPGAPGEPDGPFQAAAGSPQGMLTLSMTHEPGHGPMYVCNERMIVTRFKAESTLNWLRNSLGEIAKADCTAFVDNVRFIVMNGDVAIDM